MSPFEAPSPSTGIVKRQIVPLIVCVIKKHCMSHVYHARADILDVYIQRLVTTPPAKWWLQAVRPGLNMLLFWGFIVVVVVFFGTVNHVGRLH